jgi:WD40 repeat protein
MIERSSQDVCRLSGSSMLVAVVAFVLVEALASGPLWAQDALGTTLPTRALVQIGTGDVRTRNLIRNIVYSPDGRLIAAAENAGSSSIVSLFETRTGRRVGRIKPPEPDGGSALCLAFSPDGTTLAWGEEDGHVALWDRAADRLFHRDTLHDGHVNALAFSPDGRLVASGGADGAVRVRTVERPGDIAAHARRSAGRSRQRSADRTLRDADSEILSLAFTPDSTRLVAGATSQASIIIWRLSDGQVFRRIAGAHETRGRPSNASPGFVAVTPDGRRIISAGRSMVPRAENKIPSGNPIVPVSEVRAWDIETGERLLELCDNEDIGLGNAALSHDGRRLAVADFDVIRIHDAATGRSERRIAVPGSSLGRPEFSPDGTLLALPVGRAIHIFEVATGRRRLQDERDPAGEMRAVAWSSSGDRIATLHEDGIVRTWQADTGRLIWHRRLTRETAGVIDLPFSVAFSDDGRRLVAGGWRHDPATNQNGVVAIYDAASGTLVREMPEPWFHGVALASDGRIIVVNIGQAMHPGRLLGVEPETGRVRWSAPAEGERADFAAVIGMQIRARTPLLESATADGHVVRFNALTGHEILRFRVDGRPPEERDARPDRPLLMRASFSADGRTLATTMRDWIYVWDIETGKARREIHLAHQEGCFLALAPDGRTLAIGTGPYPEDAIRLVDLETGKEWLVLRPADQGPRALVFSPDGGRLFTGFDSGSGMVWDVRRREGEPGKNQTGAR